MNEVNKFFCIALQCTNSNGNILLNPGFTEFITMQLYIIIITGRGSVCISCQIHMDRGHCGPARLLR